MTDYPYELPPAGAVVVVDTEGSGLYADDGARVSTVSWWWRDQHGFEHAFALPFGQGMEHEHDVGEEVWHALMTRLTGCKVVFHNAAHDLAQIDAGTIAGYTGYDLSHALYFDTMLAARQLDPLEFVGLEPACGRIGIEPWKHQLDEYKTKNKVGRKQLFKTRYDLMPWEVTEPYATDDAVNTGALYESQLARLAEDETASVFWDQEMPLASVLFRLEKRGVPFDAEGCTVEADKLGVCVDEADRMLPDGMRNKAGKLTAPAMRRFYYVDNTFRPTKIDPKTDKMVQSVDEYSRQGLRAQGAPYVDEVDTWMDYFHALTAWYQPWPAAIGDDGRLRMRIRQAKVRTGRFSGERVSLLAIPHDHQIPEGITPIRSFIRPAPGRVIVEVDLSQAEVRVGCAAAGCDALIGEYKRVVTDPADKIDVYARAAFEVFGVERSHAEFRHYRDLCKRLVLAMIYAAGAKTLVIQVKKFMGIDITEAEAADALQRFRSRYPEFKRCERKWMRFVESQGYVPLALGGRKYFAPYEQLYKAFNARIQGSVSVGMKQAMIVVDRERPDIQMLLQTHDSLMIETDEGDTDTPAYVAKVMCDTFAKIFSVVPFEAEIKQW